jgi:hypothetical protein
MLIQSHRNNMSRTTIILSDEIIWDIKQVGLLENLSQREVITNAVESFLKKYKTKKDLPVYPFNNKNSSN